MKQKLEIFSKFSLTRSEMSSIKGGLAGACKTGHCRLVIWNSATEEYISYDGMCESSGAGLPVQPENHCFCKTDQSHVPAKLKGGATSNCFA